MNRRLFWFGYLLAIVAIVWIIWRQRKEEIERRLETMRQGGPFAQDWLRQEQATPAEKTPASRRQSVAQSPAPEREEEPEEGQKAGQAEEAELRADDLQAISGIGPAFEQRLKDAGITRYAQIAALSEEEIRERINLDPWRGDVASWIEQAQRLTGEA